MATSYAWTTYKLQPGYAETSTKKHPREPETVVVGSSECDVAKCVGVSIISGIDYLAFKLPGKSRYYFQTRR